VSFPTRLLSPVIGTAQWNSAGLLTRRSVFRVLAGSVNFSVHQRFHTGTGAYPDSYPMGNRVSFPVVKRPGSEANHSPPSSAEIKNASIPPISLHGVVLKKSTGTLTLPIG
jgi:hypothetical protein